MVPEMMAWRVPAIVICAALLLSFNTELEQAEDSCCLLSFACAACLHVGLQDLDWVELFAGEAQISKHFDQVFGVLPKLWLTSFLWLGRKSVCL